MTSIYLIRHAEAEGNLYRFAQGQYESCITSHGYKQIEALAERFKDVHLDKLYSSDLLRTRTTATAITKYHDLKLNTDPALREICLGVCEGMSFGDMRKFDPVQMDNFNNDPWQWVAPNAETFYDCTMRIFTAVKRIAEENDGRTVAVVSHGMAIRSLLMYLMGKESKDVRILPHGDNTAVSLLHYENGVFSVEYYNDNSHLSDELSTFAKQQWWREESKGRDEWNLSYARFDPRSKPEVYLDYYRSAWLYAHGNLELFAPDWFLQNAIRRVSSDPDSLIGVYKEDELIGLLELDSDKGRRENYGWISLICLDEKHRNIGLGVQPLGYAILYYRKLGRTAIRLHVSELNTHAIAFYKRYGFKPIRVEDGAGARLYLMEKTL